MISDLIIIGGGPAACAAFVYAARKQIKVTLIAEEFGGQSAVSNEIYNWIGTPTISGTELAHNLKKHVLEYVDIDKSILVKDGSRANKIEKIENCFQVTLSNSEILLAKSVLIATGSRRRKLEVKGAETFDNKGVMYCATCDAPLFGGVKTAIVGGGNAAFEGALQLSQYSTHVTLIHRNDNFKADQITIDKVKGLSNVEIITNAELVEIYGNTMVEGLKYKIKGEENIKEIKVSGIFVEIGQLPNTELVEGLIEFDEYKKIITDPRTQRTSVEGIWSAGDCTDGLYHQNNIAAGDAIKAIENIFIWLKTGK